MTQAKSGDTVRIHYTGTLKDGSVFDSSRGRDPLEFPLGAGVVIAGFDKGVTGMTVGETRRIEIPCDEAYGPYRAELKLEVPAGDLPPDMNPEVGMQLQVTDPSGMPFLVTVVSVTPETIGLDANHPLAGQDLTFDLELVEIK